MAQSCVQLDRHTLCSSLRFVLLFFLQSLELSTRSRFQVSFQTNCLLSISSHFGASAIVIVLYCIVLSCFHSAVIFLTLQDCCRYLSAWVIESVSKEQSKKGKKEQTQDYSALMRYFSGPLTPHLILLRVYTSVNSCYSVQEIHRSYSSSRSVYNWDYLVYSNSGSYQSQTVRRS